jgi:CheY-like chemotaxis protein
VQSEQGKGSTFSFYIKCRHAKPPDRNSTIVGTPVRSVVPIVQATDTSMAKENAPSPPLQASQSYPKYHILVVEDNLINQRVLCNQLKKIGCTVQVANHGGEALKELHKTTYYRSPTVSPPLPLSVVLMDVEMPVLDGLACTRRIRALQEEGEVVGHVPIIAVSANARREQIEEAKKAGMDDAISKPFRIPELMAVVERLLMKL